MSVGEICMKVKSITAKEIFKRFPEVKAKLWEGIFGQVDITQIQLVNTVIKKL